MSLHNYQPGDLVFYTLGERYERRGDLTVEIVTRTHAIVVNVTKTRVVIRVGGWWLDRCIGRARNTTAGRLTLFMSAEEAGRI